MDRHEVAKEQTREAIQQAYVSLLQTCDYNDITVREIAEHANIGFKTFYRHYNDKDDLTRVLYGRLWQDFFNQVSPASADVVDNVNNIRQLLRTIQENAHLMRAMLVIRAHTDLLSEDARAFSRAQIKLFHPEAFSGNGEVNRKLHEFVAARFLSGQLDLIKWWVEDDFSLSIDTMTTLILKLVVEPILSLNLSAVLEDDER